jgi:cell division protein FtsW
MKTARKVDKQLLISTLVLSVVGVVIFLSAALGFLERGTSYFSSIALKQIFFAFIPGLFLMWLFSRIDYRRLRPIALYFFLGAIVLNLLLFVPHLGFGYNGAIRWFNLPGFSFQPSELLKIGAILYFAMWLSDAKEEVKTWRFGLLPTVVLIGIVAALCLLQKDTDTFFIISASLFFMYFSAGGKFSHIAALVFFGILLLGSIALLRPYVMQRIETYFNPSANSLTASYQIQQSLIAVGSGGITGRGLGQSVQKFGDLPEPVGDSIFAVAAEEFGFVGSVTLLGLFMFFVMRALKVARAADRSFGSYLVVGIASYIFIQAFVNIGAMVGLLPLSGIPLPFVSQGGTALLLLFIEVGIIFNVSRFSSLK